MAKTSDSLLWTGVALCGDRTALHLHLYAVPLDERGGLASHLGTGDPLRRKGLFLRAEVTALEAKGEVHCRQVGVCLPKPMISVTCRHRRLTKPSRSVISRDNSDETAIGVLQMHLNLVSAVHRDWLYMPQKYHSVCVYSANEEPIRC